MSNQVFLHIYTKDRNEPLLCTLNSMEEMLVKDDFYFFPSIVGKRFMIHKDNLSRVEVGENKIKR